MKAEELKNYLRLRWVKVTDKKAVLVARAFSAFENNVALIKPAEEVPADLKEDCDDKLKLDEINTPDSFKLKHGCLDEDEGIAYWPMDRIGLLAYYAVLDDRQCWRSVWL